MQTFSRTTAGSIREENQDHLLVCHELHLAIICDGGGVNGKINAIRAAEQTAARIKEIVHVTASHEAAGRLAEACEQALQSTDLSAIAAAWIHRGEIAAYSAGQSLILLQDRLDGQWLTWTYSGNSSKVGSFCAILLGSEGIARVIDHPDMRKILPRDIASCPDSMLTICDSTAAGLYDGDDRSIVLIKIDPADLKAGEARELELIEHYNRQISFPIWLPLSLAGLLAAAGAFAWKKLQWFLRNRFK